LPISSIDKGHSSSSNHWRTLDSTILGENFGYLFLPVIEVSHRSSPVYMNFKLVEGIGIYANPPVGIKPAAASSGLSPLSDAGAADQNLEDKILRKTLTREEMKDTCIVEEDVGDFE
jgi:hypothetical protein